MALPYKVMRKTDGPAKGMMGAMYDMMLQLTEDLSALLESADCPLSDADKEGLLEHLRRRWDESLACPLHVVGRILNPVNQEEGIYLKDIECTRVMKAWLSRSRAFVDKAKWGSEEGGGSGGEHSHPSPPRGVQERLEQEYELYLITTAPSVVHRVVKCDGLLMRQALTFCLPLPLSRTSQERLEREYSLDLITTAPSVVYRVVKRDGSVVECSNPADMPDASVRTEIQEPYVREPYVRLDLLAPKEYIGTLMDLRQERRGEWNTCMPFLVCILCASPPPHQLDILTPKEYIGTLMDLAQERRGGRCSLACPLPPLIVLPTTTTPLQLDILTPKEYIGTLMDLAQERRGEFVEMKYVTESRTTLSYDTPLGEVVGDFFDQLKSRTKGYASMEYKVIGYRKSNLVKMDIQLNGEIVEPLSAIVHQEKAYGVGRALTQKLKELIPRQMFKIPIQVRSVFKTPIQVRSVFKIPIQASMHVRFSVCMCIDCEVC
ncbi:unnamed protein product [Closterium sp. NIES-64]|nr:unnamed protein product [Closterium sp. NIES-64]